MSETSVPPTELAQSAAQRVQTSNPKADESVDKTPPPMTNTGNKARLLLMTSRNFRADSQRSTDLRKLESNGLLSSIFSVAHNAANIMGKQDDSNETLDQSNNSARNKSLSIIPPLNRFSQLNLPSVLTITPNAGDLDATVSPSSYSGDLNATSKGKTLLASNVHFELIQKTPLSTLGNGDLSLLHFEKTKLEKKPPLDSRNSNPDTLQREQLVRKATVTSSSRVSRRKLIASSVEESKQLLENSDGENKSLLSDSQSFVGGDLDYNTPSKKRNIEFHHAFKNVPSLEKLIASFSCALSKEILVQGKLYLSRNFICFNSNILGWVTNLIIPLQEVIQIEKKSTVLWFPNGMAITTLHQKHAFATFHSRDTAFDLMTKVWKKSLRSDKTSKPPRLKRKSTARLSMSRKTLENSEWSDEEGLFSDQDDDIQLLALSEEDSADERENIMTRNYAKKRSRPVKNEDESDHDGHDLDFEVDVNADDSSSDAEDVPKTSKKGESTFKGFTNPGPSKHAPTSFEHQKNSSDVHIIDKNFNAPLGVVFNMLYGSDNATYVKVLEALKNFDITKEKITELSNDLKERNYSYIKPLSGPIGPKQTKCLITETLEACSFDNYCEVQQITQTPDVPLGNSFKIKTLLFFTWGENNTTNMTVYTSIEWSAKSWIKSAIEKGSIDGQKQSMKTLSDVVSNTLATKDLSGSGTKKKRRPTTVNSPQNLEKDETELQPKRPLSFLELISKLLESIGLHAGISVPMLDNATTGAIILILLSLFYSLILIWMARGNSNISFGKNGSQNVIEINGRPYNLVATPETYLGDPETRKELENKMWDWIISRTDSDANRTTPSRKMNLQGHDLKGFEEIVDLTRKRLDEVYYNLH